MEYADLECKEVLTLESLAVEMTRMHHIDHNHSLESLLNDWRQGCDATVITETARKMLDACTGLRETEDTCMSDLDAAGFDDLDAAGFADLDDLDAAGFADLDDLDDAGFSDFYGAGHEDPPRTGHEDLSSAFPYNAGACGSTAAGIGTDITACYRGEHRLAIAARG